MDGIGFRLLNDFQRDLPLCERPFAALAHTLGCSETEVLARLRTLQDSGAVSRVGAVLRPGTVGASTLAAMSVPAERLRRVAETVTAFPEVNHNYEREHRFNLWFVVTASDGPRLDQTLQAIAAAARSPVMSLPLVREYRIDLGFDLQDGPLTPNTVVPKSGQNSSEPPDYRPGRFDTALLAGLQQGLALVSRPYAELASRAGLTESAVIERIAALIEQRVIKRFGVVVRHRDLGFVANAMVVFDVPDEAIDRAGANIANSALASLCYRRARCLPDWPYSLFCMIHSRTRRDALFTLAELRTHCRLSEFPHEVLFSRECFKQRGAHYFPAAAAAHG